MRSLGFEKRTNGSIEITQPRLMMNSVDLLLVVEHFFFDFTPESTGGGGDRSAPGFIMDQDFFKYK